MSTKRFTMVVAVDFSDLSNEAVRVATNLARASGDAAIHLVHVVAPPIATGDVPGMYLLDDLGEEARQRLAEVQARVIASAGTLPVTARTIFGAPREVLPRVAGDLRADLVVVGTHGRKGLARLAFGSVAEAVVRHAPCAVLVVRPRVLGAEELIEPPCPACEARAKASGGEEPFCARHAPHHVEARIHRETPASFGLGSLTIRPEQ